VLTKVTVKKKPVALVIGMVTVILLGVLVLAILSAHQPQRAPRVIGPLSTNDVAEIEQVVLRGRAPLSGWAAPKGALGWERRLRERAAGQIRSITSVNGQTANVDFGDRWNSKIGYDYDLERTTNGWKVIGVGYRESAGKAGR
jgi:hypothetical protein